MILLIGSTGWVHETKKLLTDRTSHSKKVVTVTSMDKLRGITEHIEIITDNFPRTMHDIQAISLAQQLNEMNTQRRQTLNE